MNEARSIAVLAQRALLYEAVCQPKPGLVDPVSVGSHSDMTIFTFIDSSCELLEDFEAFFIAGHQFEGTNLQVLFNNIRPLGIQAEANMLQATNGVNTHKGAIFSLGILLAAIGYLSKRNALTDTEAIFEVVMKMTTHLMADFEQLSDKPLESLSNGEKLFLAHGLLGVRGQVSQGFPVVRNYSLPLLKRYGAINNENLLNVLMLILFYSEDSNLIKRAGDVTVLQWGQKQVEEFFLLGGSKTKQGLEFLTEMNATFVHRNLSIGGTADLLIVTIFMYLIETSILK